MGRNLNQALDFWTNQTSRRIQRWGSCAALAFTFTLSACAIGPSSSLLPEAQAAERVKALPDASLIVLGEEHDAPAHHQLEEAVVAHLAAKGRLAFLLLEMADHGRSTSGMSAQATESQVREALAWNEQGWPWADYGPAVMSAVRASVPVMGANLPRAQHKEVMATTQWDQHLPVDQRDELLDRIKASHCGLLPDAQLPNMARIQVARDATMAKTATDALLQSATAATSPQTVLLVVGGEHARRDRGVPTHLSASVAKDTHVVLMESADLGTEMADKPSISQADAVWETPPLTREDPCEAMKKAFAKPR